MGITFRGNPLNVLFDDDDDDDDDEVLGQDDLPRDPRLMAMERGLYLPAEEDDYDEDELYEDPNALEVLNDELEDDDEEDEDYVPGEDYSPQSMDGYDAQELVEELLQQGVIEDTDFDDEDDEFDYNTYSDEEIYDASQGVESPSFSDATPEMDLPSNPPSP